MATYTDRIAVIIEAFTGGTTKELESLQREAKKSGDAFDTLGKQVGLAGSTIKAGLAAGAAAFVGGGLLKLLGDSVQKFQESQEAARQWSQMTNSSVEEAGRFTTVLRQYGIELGDLAEINAEFSQTVKQQPQLLESLNVQIQKNADGTTNMSATMAGAIEALQGMEDGVAQTQAAFELFGEEGAKQLLPLINSGRDLSEVMEKIDFVNASEQSREFAANSADLALSFEQVQIQLGNFLVPALSELMGLASGVIEFFSTLPGWVVDLATALGIAAGATLAFKKVMELLKSEAAGQLFVNMVTAIAPLAGKFHEAAGAAAKAKVAFTEMKVALAGLATAAAPLLVLTAIIEAFIGAQKSAAASKEFVTSVDNMGMSLREMGNEAKETDSVFDTLMTGIFSLGKDSTETTLKMFQLSKGLEESARATLENASATDEQKRAAQELLDVQGEGARWTKAHRLDTEQGTKAIEDYQKSLHTAADAAGEYQKAHVSLTDMIARGDYTQQELAAAVKETGEAQQEQKRIAHDTAGAMLAYATSSEKASYWQDELNLVIEDGVTSGARFEGVAREAAEAMFKQSENTRIAQEALDGFNFSYEQMLEDLAETDKFTGGIESVKQQLQNLDWSQVGDSYVNEWEITAEEARGILINSIREALKDTPGLDPIQFLQQFRTQGPSEINKAIDSLEQEIRENPLTVQSEVKTPTTDEIRARIAEINTILASTWNEQVTGPLIKEKEGLEAQLAIEIPVAVSMTGDAATEQRIQELIAPKSTTYTLNAAYNPSYNDMVMRQSVLTEDLDATVTWNAEYNPGYNDMVMRLATLTEDHTPDIDYWVHFNPGSYQDVVNRLNHIMSFDGKTPDINVFVHLNPAYNDIKARLDYIARDRTATINVSTRGLAAAEAALGIGANQRIAMPSIEYSPMNLVRVEVDGRELRAVVRDEISNLQPVVQGVA